MSNEKRKKKKKKTLFGEVIVEIWTSVFGLYGLVQGNPQQSDFERIFLVEQPETQSQI